jgi:uncharacterized protein YbjT (DUF2867 family)
VTRHLLRGGWRVRALTRTPDGTKARALAALGAEVVRADMGDRASLLAALRGAHGVYSVQNPMTSGLEAEVRQGTLVAEVAKEVGVGHLVYGSAGTGQAGTGIGSWESKLAVERRMKELGLPVTVLRPTAFMELMTDRGYFPGASTWHLMPKLMGASRPVAWLSVDDLGAIAAAAFADPDQFVGADLKLASDVQTIDACRALYREVVGKAPPRMPMPLWLFERFAGKDVPTMWRWLGTAGIDWDTATARAIHPGALTVREWLGRQPVAGKG